MNQPYDTLEQNFGYALSGAQRNRVLRNTYWLLAISMVPTILGAWIGVETGVAAIFNGMLGFVLMLAGMFGFIYAIERTKNSADESPKTKRQPRSRNSISPQSSGRHDLTPVD